MPLDLSSQNCREHSYKPPSQVKCASIQSKVLGHMNWSSIAERKKNILRRQINKITICLKKFLPLPHGEVIDVCGKQ